jgi:hypothetical protein
MRTDFSKVGDLCLSSAEMDQAEIRNPMYCNQSSQVTFLHAKEKQ